MKDPLYSLCNGIDYYTSTVSLTLSDAGVSLSLPLEIFSRSCVQVKMC